MKTVEMTLYRCYWPVAFRYLNIVGERHFFAKAYDLLMTLELNYDDAYAIADLLPTGAVITILHELHLTPTEFEDPWAWGKSDGSLNLN